jgi:hypothetical protein
MIAVLYFGFPAVWQRIIHLGRDVQPPLAVGADVVVLAHAVPWGTLSLSDGAAPATTPSPQPTGSPQVSPAPTATMTPAASTTPQASVTPQASKTPTALKASGTTADGYAWYKLARGKHTLVYAAAPFATVTCQISVPEASGDTCPLAQVQSSAGIRALGAARVVDAQATADHLGADQRTALFGAIQTALNPQPTTVQIYERYLNGSGQAVMTYVTLQASLLYTVNTDAAHAIPLPTPPPTATPGTPPGTTPTATGTAGATPSTTPPAATATASPPPTCLSLCDALFSADAPTDAWNAFVNVLPSWSYAPARGQPISGPAAAQGSAATSAVVNIRWNGQWQVGVKDVDKAGLLSNAVAAYAGALPLPAGWSVKVYPAANPADGYLVVATSGAGAVAQLLYRFGVLLSLNSVAYTTFPTLHHANTAEHAIAAGIKTE